MASTPDRLSGIRAKIERAKHHIRDLDAALQAFGKVNRNALRSENDPQTGEKVYRVNLPDIPVSIPLLIGDAVHNLRSAFDHLAWQLVEANGQTPDDKTSYPVCKTAAVYNKSSTHRKVQGISPAAVRLIEATQPYQSGYDGLGKLSELDNFDKHRLLIVAAVKLGDIAFGTSGSSFAAFLEIIKRSGSVSLQFFVPESISSPPSGVRILEDGDEFCRVQPTGGSEQYAQVDFTFDIAFREPQVVYGEPVLPLLTQLAQLVEGVVNQFLPFL